MHIILHILFAVVALQLQIPQTPSRLVTDYAGVLSSAEVDQLERELVALDDSTSNQIAIAIFPSLEGEAISDLTTRVAQAWGIGQQGRDNGVLILMSKKEREVFIAPGYGLEGALPDLLVKRIVDDHFIPHAKQGNFLQAFRSTVEAIRLAIRGEYTALPKEKSKSSIIIVILFFVILFSCIVFFVRNRNNRRNDNDGGSGGSGLLWATPFLLGSMSGRHSHSSFGSGGFGGGGFGGFGGGGFGGGGAGGSW